MTSILSGIICFIVFFSWLIRIIGRAIQANNRDLEARRQQLAREMEAAEAARTAPKTECRDEKEQHAPHQALQPTNTRNTKDKQAIKSDPAKDPIENFDLRKAVIASEILRPKFDE